MRRLSVILLISLICFLPGCGPGFEAEDGTVSTETAGISCTSTEDCYLCGSIENGISSYGGQNNIALLSLNTFEIKPIEINRYDWPDGQPIEEYAGFVTFSFNKSQNGGFSASLIQNYDRGYASVSVNFHHDEILDINKAANFLCADCLNEILSDRIGDGFGVGAVNLATKEVRILEEGLKGFTLGDFYMDCNPQDRDNGCQMDILVFYCPVRYQKDGA